MQGIIRDAVMSNNNKTSSKDQCKSEKYTKINPRLSIDDAFADRSYSFRVNWMKDEKLLHQLKKDNIDIELFQCEIKRETCEKNNKTVKGQLLLFLQSNPIQIIIALLVLVDAGIVIAEIILEIHSLKNSIEAHQEQIRETIHFINQTFPMNLPHITAESDHGGPSNMNNEITVMESILENLNTVSLQNCTASYLAATSSSSKLSISNTSSSVAFRNAHLQTSVKPPVLPKKYQPPHIIRLIRSASSSISSSSNHNNKLANKVVNSSSHKVSVKKHRSQIFHVVSETLHYASIVILSLFVLEVALKISCVGMKFFKAKYEVVDAVVIVTSFVADIIIVKVGSQEISVMIIFLLWRIVRVINGLLMHEKQRDEFRIALQKKARRVSEMKVEQLTIQNEMQEKHVMALEEVLRDAGISEIIIKRCRPKYIQYSKDQTNNPLKSIAAMTTGFMGGLVGAQPSNKEINRFAASYSPSCTPRNRSPLSQKKIKINSNAPNTSVTFLGDYGNNNNNIGTNNGNINNANTKRLEVCLKRKINANSKSGVFNSSGNMERYNSSTNNYAETWYSSTNSVFEYNSSDNQLKFDRKSLNNSSNDDDDDENDDSHNRISKSTSSNIDYDIGVKKMQHDECLEDIHSYCSPLKDFTSPIIMSPFIDDNHFDTSDCSASVKFSLNSSEYPDCEENNENSKYNSKKVIMNSNDNNNKVIFRCFHQAGSNYTLIPSTRNDDSSDRAVDYV